MVRRNGGILIVSSLLGIVASVGCGPNATQTPAYEIHDASQFTKEALNAPLSAEAKAKGAQVAPPPTR